MIIKGDIDWSEKYFEKLPDISESIVYGTFSCSWCENLTSLEGAPKEVGGGFYCGECSKLEALVGAPKEVGGGFCCCRCENLTSLEGAPERVGGYFDCSVCEWLESAKGLPMHIGGEIYFDYQLRHEIDKELERRKKQANQSTLPPNGFSNSGR